MDTIVRFDNGVEVKFDRDPTPQDIEEVAAKLGIKPKGFGDRFFKESATYGGFPEVSDAISDIASALFGDRNYQEPYDQGLMQKVKNAAAVWQADPSGGVALDMAAGLAHELNPATTVDRFSTAQQDNASRFPWTPAVGAAMSGVEALPMGLGRLATNAKQGNIPELLANIVDQAPLIVGMTRNAPVMRTPIAPLDALGRGVALARGVVGTPLEVGAAAASLTGHPKLGWLLRKANSVIGKPDSPTAAKEAAVEATWRRELPMVDDSPSRSAVDEGFAKQAKTEQLQAERLGNAQMMHDAQRLAQARQQAQREVGQEAKGLRTARKAGASEVAKETRTADAKYAAANREFDAGVKAADEDYNRQSREFTQGLKAAEAEELALQNQAAAESFKSGAAEARVAEKGAPPGEKLRFDPDEAASFVEDAYNRNLTKGEAVTAVGQRFKVNPEVAKRLVSKVFGPLVERDMGGLAGEDFTPSRNIPPAPAPAPPPAAPGVSNGSPVANAVKARKPPTTPPTSLAKAPKPAPKAPTPAPAPEVPTVKPETSGSNVTPKRTPVQVKGDAAADVIARSKVAQENWPKAQTAFGKLAEALQNRGNVPPIHEHIRALHELGMSVEDTADIMSNTGLVPRNAALQLARNAKKK